MPWLSAFCCCSFGIVVFKFLSVLCFLVLVFSSFGQTGVAAEEVSVRVSQVVYVGCCQHLLL